MMRATIAFFRVLGPSVFGLLLLAGPARGEGISGLVKDQQGAVLPGATVVVENAETGVKREIVTNDEGRYDATGLQPGTYSILASLPGFASVVRRGVTLTVARDLFVDFVLELGDMKDEIVVTGEAPLIDTTSATVSGLVDERAMRELPLVSRSWDELIKLQAGTAVFRRVDPGVLQGFTSQFTVGGQRPTSNKFYQDGTELGGAQGIVDTPGSSSGVNLGVEGIREFRVLTNSYSPEYGKRAGGAIITVTKSGTNEFHGSAFEFYRNDSLDAQNYFATGKNPFNRNAFGGSVGGPIVRDRSFFFGNYEGLRETLTTPVSLIVPNDQARQGFLPDAGGRLTQVGIHPSVAPFLGLWPAANGRDFGDGTAAYDFGSPRKLREDYAMGRFDHQFSQNDSLSVSYTISDGDQNDQQTLGPFFYTLAASRQQRATVEHKHISSSSLLYTFRFGFNRAFWETGPRQLVEVPGVTEFTPGRGIGSIDTAGLGPAGSGSTGNTTSAKSHYQFSGQASYVRGRHTFDVGGQGQHIAFDEDSPARSAGTWEFAGLREMLLGVPRRFNGQLPNDATGTLPIGLPVSFTTEKNFRQEYMAVFFRDRIRWTSTLSLDLGIRYEFLTSPTEINGRFGNFDIVDVLPPFNYVLAGTPTVGKKIYETDYGAGLAPRLGVAWDPFGRGKTSVHAGFGLFFDQIESEYRWYSRTNPPFDAALDLQNPSIALFPNPWVNTDISRAIIGARSIDKNLDVPRVKHFNAGIEHQVGAGGAIRATYVGSRGSHLLVGNQGNLRVPQVVDGNLFWTTTAPLTQPLLGRVNLLQSNATSAYDALQAEFETRFAASGLFRRLRSKFAYAYAKTVDDQSQIQTSAAQSSRSAPTNPLEVDGDRGLSAQHVAHMFSINFTYDVQDVGLGGIGGALLRNWQINGIATMTSGLPVNVIVGFNRSRNGHDARVDRPDLVSGGSANPVNGGPNQYFDPAQFALQPAGFLGNLGANTLIGPGFVTFDLSVVRQVPLTDRYNVQVRLEGFNLFNHPNFGLPDSAIFNSNGTVRGAAGRITTTASANRQMQLGVRFTF